MEKTPLRNERERRNLTISSVASSVGIDPGNLSRIERGTQVPSIDIAEKLSKYFDGTVTEMQILFPSRFREKRAATDEVRDAA